jgi:hypothetical protein
MAVRIFVSVTAWWEVVRKTDSVWLTAVNRQPFISPAHFYRSGRLQWKMF